MRNTPIRILVIDDDQDDFVLIRDMLEDIPADSFDVEWSSEYEAGMEVLRSNRYDLAMVDYRLGGRTGVELVRELAGDGRETPIILMTGVAGYEIGVEGMRLGASDFLVKNEMTPSLVERTVRYVLERKRSSDRVKKLNSCLLGFGPNPDKNIKRLLTTCGELFNADCAVYRRADNEGDGCVASWKLPDAESAETLPGRYVSERISANGDVTLLTDLQEHAGEDACIARSGLNACIGKVVKLNDTVAGVLCVFYTTDASALTGPHDEQLISIVGSAIATEEARREAIRQTRRENAKLQSMIAGMEEGFVFANAEGEVEEVNGYLLRSLGTDADSIIGRLIWDVFSQHCTVDVRAAVEQLRSDDERSSVTEQCRISGTDVIFRVQAIRSENELLGFLVNTIDVSELVSARESAERAKHDLEAALERAEALTAVAEDASLSKSQFLANVNHELRTPLNGVLGMLGLVLDGPIAGEQLENVLLAKESADTLLRVVNDVLSFAEVDSGKLELRNEDFDPRKLVAGVVEGQLPNTSKAGLELAWHVEDSVPEQVAGDPACVRQILNGLVANAIKFTSEGEIEVRARRLHEYEKCTTLEFSVRDTGVGIPALRQRTIFEPFRQGDGSSTRKYGGIGLGLALGWQLAEMMNGRLTVRSEEGKGSTFFLTVEFDAASTCPDAEPAAPCCKSST